MAETISPEAALSLIADLPVTSTLVDRAMILGRAGYAVAPAVMAGRGRLIRGLQLPGHPIGGLMAREKAALRRLLTDYPGDALALRNASGELSIYVPGPNVIVPYRDELNRDGPVYAEPLARAPGPEPAEPARSQPNSEVPDRKSALTGLKAALKHVGKTSQPLIDLAAEEARIERERLAAEQRLAELTEARDRADADALLNGSKPGEHAKIEVEIARATSLMRAASTARATLARRREAARAELDASRQAVAIAAHTYSTACREALARDVREILGNLAGPLASLIATERKQREFLGDSFRFSGRQAPALWSGEVAALALSKAIPERLRPSCIEPQALAALADEQFALIEKEIEQ